MTAKAREVAEEAARCASLGALRDLRPVGGGDVAAAYRLDAETGPGFLKIGTAAQAFDAEAQALAEIGAAAALRAPQVLACGAHGGCAYLLLEWIELAQSGDWLAAGRGLARLHGRTQQQYGWHRDNTIGASPQANAATASWAEFYRERRLRPQFALATALGQRRLAALEARACAASDALLEAFAPSASLLHGDLWRGNLAFDRDGRPVLFDPATYYGDAETDIAMSRLFGGFPQEFYRAYADARAPLAGAADRLPLYQLYHVLNHANIFGGAYVGQAIAMIEGL